MGLNEFCRSAKAFEEELEDFDMPDSFSDVFAPGVHSVSSDEVTPAFFVGVCCEVFFDLDHEGRDVLGIIKNGDPHARFVGCDTFESFQHFESADTNSTEGREMF